MKFTFATLSFFLLSLLGCNNRNGDDQSRVIDDTSRTFIALFNEDFLARHMAGYGAIGVGQPSIFGDTILLQFNDSLDKYIPQKFGNHFLKRISRDSLCRLAKHYEEISKFPDFLELLKFEKNDSGYTLMIHATCVFPDRREGKEDASKQCIFGMMCGGGFSVAAVKRKDSFYLRSLGAWSD